MIKKKSKKEKKDTKGGYLLIRNIPQDVKKKFKVFCATKGITMRDAIVNFMRGK